ncbi:class I SAM-dependent methyltransferase [Actinomadura montaniterrae]|uniref:Class I SAM-dependent methyltransferase n=1 Tax=Actinomadura montaniterrae TaxID=1803903 RepID=A0A6L3W690_9ACTN|nr:class I SAM-dependent methyltransferase [Actinomadura montaniterrae]KAB2388486.1 class I SAM-dependent methyltransferase [Actinomadura montaniterrae]
MSERTGDGYGGRRATSHERMTGLQWDESYQGEEPAPWDAGRPQPAVERLADEGAFTGPVLDAGCGTGENALRIAAAGARVLGVDVAGTALAMAREKARDRGLDAEFALADAFQLARLGRTFETVLDCGLFHTFDDGERGEYVESLAAVTASGGRLFLLCFSDAEPGDWGPRRVTRDELRRSFDRTHGWEVESITPERLVTNFGGEGVAAWLAAIRRA